MARIARIVIPNCYFMFQELIPRMLKRHRRVILFSIFLCACAQTTANAHVLDQYEIKDRMQNVRTIYMLKPQIILGRRDEKHGLFTGDEPGKKMAQRAILNAATDAFVQQGYGFTSVSEDDANTLSPTDYQQEFQAVWQHLDQFADAGREKKPKLWPFSIAPDQQSLVRSQEVDAIAFVQCYGKFDSVVTADAEVPGKVIFTVAQLALTGAALIFSADYASLEFKLSVIDSRTGELIFYRESSEDQTDVRDSARLTGTFTEAFKWYLPKALNPAPLVKFKHKRSEIAAQGVNGGSSASTS